ncbi:unnamed protein product [Polarella glacialis]|uniref:RanBP2-type domain-containing protein n=3 Tax=Polarella glacialis TaxID=89957 RepID=A0A813LWY2_POLGL|nr:unnamed protein product [Polarella glacialis]
MRATLPCQRRNLLRLLHPSPAFGAASNIPWESQRRMMASEGQVPPREFAGAGGDPDEQNQEPPLWLLAFGPFSVLAGAILFSARNDIVGMFGDEWAMRNGGWPCPLCLRVNKAAQEACDGCQSKRPDEGDWEG